MKKGAVIIFVLLSLFSGKVFCQTSDSTLNTLLGINKSVYTNKPLDSLILVIPSGYIEIRVVGIRKTARNLRIMYPNRVWIDLHVRQFNHMSPVDPNRIWNVSQMRLENLHSVSVYKGINCYEGCPNF